MFRKRDKNPAKIYFSLEVKMNYMNQPRGNCSMACDGDSSLNNDPLKGMPLGIGYVPWQQWGRTYNYCEGLSKGTIFPDLDLPFYGCIPRGFRCGKGGKA